MNRGVFQSSLVQQMMGESPSWCGMNNMRPTPEQISPLLPSASSSSSSSVFPQYPQPSNFLPMTSWHENQDLPESWSQLLLGGLVGEEERCSFTPFQAKKIDNWDDQVVYPSASAHMVDVKQEGSEGGYVYSHGNGEIRSSRSPWGQILPVSSQRSCVTTSFSSNMLNFSNNKGERRHHQPDQSSECNSTATGAAFKKARVQGPSSAQSTFKVRKEKLGDRITALHQLVSPFGKTDTASVLLEAIGYIRFLQSQIEVQGERNCIFPEDPGQLLNDNCTKKRGPPDQDASDEPKKDLRSRGLCLVPVSCTLHVGSDNGADYWAPSLGGVFR
ncbi:transcription factor bHLH68 isoform X2 [Elaeis guineensis]|uniref:Transcription factor bHLH68 isoform X2 n=1 Tax=Elaeis guineensis var. tenera TaxID=51953 RepID=A0A6I9QVI1_ELAGV|nr:transcription factor bHLH68 isoform X2 [Elaeis guineensis]